MPLKKTNNNNSWIDDNRKPFRRNSYTKKGENWRQGNLYVERSMEELVCAKKEMGLHEEKEREFDVFVLLCLRLTKGEIFFFNRVLVLGEKGILFYSNY